MDAINSDNFDIPKSVHFSCSIGKRAEHKSLIVARSILRNTQPMSVSMEIGSRIRSAREAKGWSQETLARHLSGIKKSRLGNWEQGTRRPGVEEAQQLSRALEVSVAFLLCVDEESSLSTDEKTLIAKYRMADNRGKGTIQGVADSQSAYQIGPETRKAS